MKRIYVIKPGAVVHSSYEVILEDGDVELYISNMCAKGFLCIERPLHKKPDVHAQQHARFEKSWNEAWDKVFRGETKVSNVPMQVRYSKFR